MTERAPKFWRWRIIWPWNLAVLILFLVAPYEWKLGVILAGVIGMVIHLAEAARKAAD
ncbi:hypothetical protein [uncultured Phenylobacterium sp.]|uniref:hypothetical protein n=1 Tax=uncultured Phenylobacterium sp. TaxID=349273 RepID=UPI0025E3D925|nr:hypothetical protein [uncultured Phenylobacterium sp.]